jgi:ubiquinol-cytochrome c reductase cytochrome b subunit
MSSHGGVPTPQPPDPKRHPALAWLESRIGYTGILKMLLDEPIPGGARWWYVFGSVLTFILSIQILTGIFLAAFYSPASNTSWASVAFIQDQLALGWFVRGLHSTGASAMVVMAILHLAQVLIYGAYRAPREMNWIVGVLMLGLVLAFALTGYLLPWDQKGYWATQVATSIISTTPLVGPALQKLLQGGSAYGTFTITHFYALHTYVLPGTIIGMLLLHLYLFRRHGVTPKWDMSHHDLVKRTEPFWPDQLYRDIVACGITFLAIVLMVLRTHGAELEAPADPASTYVARPEWYFLPLFQILKYFEGPLEVIGTMVLPGIAGALLIGLPFLDRSPTRDPRRRLAVLVGAFAGLGSVVILGVLAFRHDSRDPRFVKQRGEASERSETARSLALQGVPAGGGTAVFQNDRFYLAREIWAEKCSGCHSLTGMGGEKGPDLHDYNSREWIFTFLHNPDGPLRMGPAKIERGMKPVKGTPEELVALTELVYSQTGASDVNMALAEKAKKELFSEKDCDSCHDLDGVTENTGPNLKDRGTLKYVARIIADSGHPLLFGKKDQMPSFSDRLTPEEIDLMARFVISLKKTDH